PHIGVTTTPATVDGRPVEQVNRSYVEAVVGAGGLPFLLPVLDPDDAGAALLALDGLLLTGGGDVEPSLYGARPVPAVDGPDPAREASVAGGSSVAVNSLHHQAVDRIGAGLRAVAWSEDGVVEGLESDDVFARILGVQWHPELLLGHRAHERLFAWLVTEAAAPLSTR